jgi:AcrR family transcriptional regulator
MLGVARHAGVSTKTMYRLIPTKADLFREVISRRIGRFMLAFSVDAHDLAGLRQALTALLIAYGELSLSEEAVAIHALVLSECRRFPELAELFNAEAISGTGRAMTSWLTRHCERGLLRLEDAGQAADMLRGMMAMEPQRAILLGRRGTLDARELAERARRCADLFLDGCAA